MLEHLRAPALRFLDDLGFPVFAADRAMRIVYVNRAMETVAGVASDALVGRSIVADLPRIERAAAAARVDEWLSGRAAPYRLRYRIAGSRHLVRAIGLPTIVRAKNGEVAGVVVILLNLTDLQFALRGYYDLVAELAQDAFRNLADEYERASSRIERANPSRSARASTFKALSDREWEVAQRIIDGKRPAAVAQELSLSVATVRNHLKAVFRKAGVSTQAELVAKAHQRARTH